MVWQTTDSWEPMKELERKFRKLSILKEKRLDNKSNWQKRELHKQR